MTQVYISYLYFLLFLFIKYLVDTRNAASAVSFANNVYTFTAVNIKSGLESRIGHPFSVYRDLGSRKAQ
jgi:hypothetical protein